MRVIHLMEHCSPHQVAALETARQHFTDAGHELVPVEIYARSTVYGWTLADKARTDAWQCLFPGQASATTRAIVQAVQRSVHEPPADVLVLNGWYALYSWMLAARKRKLGCRLVLVSDSNRWDQPRSWFKEFLKRRLLKRIDACFAAGTPQREYLHDLGLPLDKITLGNDVVDNALYTALPVRLAPQGRKVVIGTAARLIPEKNLSAALQALAQVVAWHPDLELEWQIAGRGPLDAELRQLAERLRLPVVFRGFVGYDDMPRWYAGLDIYWQPSIYEPWGLVVNEAMAAGLPVLVSDRCGCARDLVTAANGWTHPAESPEGMTAAWERALATLASWPRRGEASRQIIAHWGLPRFAQGLLAACRLARSSSASNPSDDVLTL